MELRHLRYFLAVAETLHFGRAARSLGIQQPPLSQQIRALEDDLGVRLFDRTSRQVRLTAAGEAFLVEARRTVDAATAARTAAQRAGRGETDTVAVGFVGSATAELLPRLIRQYRDLHPAVRLILRELPSAEQVRALQDGSLDVGILRPPLPTGGGPELTVHPASTEHLVVALPPGHRLSSSHEVSLESLANEPFVMFPRTLGSGLYDQIVDCCRRAGFEPRVVQEATQMQTIVALAASGLGVALVPSSMTNLRQGDVVFRAIRPAPRIAPLSVAYRTELLRPATKSLVRLAATPPVASNRSSARGVS